MWGDSPHRKAPLVLQVTPYISIDPRELDEKFVRSSGPGGQNVNKVATAVQLRFDVRRSPSLPEAVRQRLLLLATNRISSDGILLIEASRFRTQEQNRQDARDRLVAMVRQATVKPKPRKPTKPSAAARKRRIESKKQRGDLKRSRRAKYGADD